MDGASWPRPASAASTYSRRIADDGPLLLHSLNEFRELIFACLDAAGARAVAEIGAEDGVFSAELLGWARDRAGRVFCVDPQPAPGLVSLAEGAPELELVQQRSVDALKVLEPCDAYLIDGDHNHYTVFTELGLIEARQAAAGKDVLVILHDMGWPAGRRDMYYAPESLPPQAVHPYTFDKGVRPGREGVAPGGFRGEGEFAWARHEGGPANGVRTAVEDFLETRPDLALSVVPSVFGLGVLYTASAPFADRLAGILATYEANPMLERLERNRIALYLRVIELQDALATAYRDLETSGLRVRDVEVENRALWARVKELETQVEGVEEARQAAVAELHAILRSRPFLVAERVSGLRRLRGASPGLSRERMRALVDGS
ncbi:MAG: class I SAM-dependent methyltransferase [Actinomycetota bacterium]|nr:class I SAM-dependent methyltransferase [Actinomycetota bacterium]